MRVTIMHPSDRSYRNQTVRIADLTVINDTVQNVTFENCILEGPAVVYMTGDGSVIDTQFEGDLDAVLWVVPDARRFVLGAVVFIDCTIVGCTLRRIGLAVAESAADELRRALSGGW